MTLRDELTELFYRHDPVGLAELGAPEDEYVPEAVNRNKPSEAVKLVRTRAQRIPSRSGAYSSTKTGYICADHTAIFTFRLRQGGGPYIPVSR